MGRIIVMFMTLFFWGASFLGGPGGCVSGEGLFFPGRDLEDITEAGDLEISIIESTTPEVGAENIDVETKITVTFIEQLDTSTLNTATFILNSQTGPVAGELSYDSASRTATFTPASKLALLAAYTATITTGLKSTSGAHMAADYNLKSLPRK